MKIKNILTLLCCASVVTGCVDDAYDLDNINTDSELKIDNLVLPINIDKILLGDVIDLNEDGVLKEESGDYVISVDGEFTAPDIEIVSIRAKAPSIAPSVQTIKGASLPSTVEYDVKFDLDSAPSDFEYEMDGVDESIVSIDDISLDNFTFTLTFSIAVENLVIKDAVLSDLSIKMPTGMEITCDYGEYDPDEGILTIDYLETENNKATITFTATKINLKGNEAADFNYNEHKFIFKSSLDVESGTISAYVANTSTTEAPTLTLTKSYVLTDMVVSAFSGEIQYSIDDININPIELNDLPDFLNQEGTNIIMSNPQIYLSTNNPLAEYNLSAQAGLSLTAYRNGQEGKTVSLNDGTFTIGSNQGNTDYSFVMAPTNPSTYPAGFNNPQFVQFTQLSNILEGNSIPTEIRVDLISPQIPTQYVKDLKLGSNLGGIQGKYMFYAPLSLANGSKIIYSEREDGWSTEDLEDLTITQLEVSTSVTSTIPAGVVLTGYPIDIDGNEIKDVQITGATVNAMAKGQKVVIRTTGTIRRLDGIVFQAVISPDGSGALAPSEYLELDDIKVKVSGSYNYKDL